jgi:hypothetical protein
MPAKKNPVAKAANKAVPTRRALVLLETGLLLGLAEGIMTDTLTHLTLSPYLKALLLMVGVIGVFAFALRIIEPIIRGSLKMIAKLDTGGGALLRIGVHLVILFLIFAAYVRVFFPKAG